jgi:hypothetical protein
MATATPNSVQTLPTARILHNCIRENRDHGFIYLNNPKVGCSTVKSALWQAVTGEKPARGAGVHAVAGSPFNAKPVDAAFAERAYIFTFVRNPYQRVVSAYLNKVIARRNPAWKAFAQRHDVGGTGLVTFDSFVEALAAVPPELHDPHWRPQHLNTLYPFVKPNLIADLESLDSLLPEILGRLFPGQPMPAAVKRKRNTATRARAIWRSQLSDAGTRKRVLDVFGADFEAFGYRTDVDAEPEPTRGPQISEHQHKGLAKLVAYLAADGQGKAPALRALEREEGAESLVDWVLAQRLRLIASNRERVGQMLESHAAQIAAGPTYLKQIAEQVRLGPAVKGQDAEE